MLAGNSVEKMRSSMLKKIEAGEAIPFGNTRKYGNGGIPTPAEAHVMGLFPQAKYNLSVAPKDGQRPYHYKIDVAWVDRKLGLEIDGSSHAYRMDADARKDTRLQRIGWTIVRVTNEEAQSENLLLRLSEFGITPDTCTTSR